jgi:hypothetical protein
MSKMTKEEGNEARQLIDALLSMGLAEAVLEAGRLRS